MGKGEFFCACVPSSPNCCFQHLLTQDRCLESPLSFSCKLTQPQQCCPSHGTWSLGAGIQGILSSINLLLSPWGKRHGGEILTFPQPCAALRAVIWLCSQEPFCAKSQSSSSAEHTCRRGSPGSVPCTSGTLPSPRAGCPQGPLTTCCSPP